MILIVVLYQFTDGDRRRPAPLRGADSPAGAAALVVQTAAVREGEIIFSWARVTDADRYEVQIYDADLREIARFGAGSDTSLTVRAGDIPGAGDITGAGELPEAADVTEGEETPQTGGPLFWRVAAFREGDEIAHSPLVPLEIGAE